MKKLFLCLLVFSLAACSSDNEAADVATDDSNMQSGDNDSNGGGDNNDDTNEPSSQMYNIRFISLWNANDHISVPGNAHFSPIVATSHNNSYALFPKGDFATAGFEDVAEIGQAGLLNSEIEAANIAGNIETSLNTRNQFIDEVLEQSFTVSITKDHPLLSFVTMIAPSPDWIVGVSGLELYNSDGFVSEEIEIDLDAYQAGTENGDFGGNYSINNTATNPQGRITKLSGNGLNAPFVRVVISPVDQ